ncbi:MAG: folate-binding protein YgfZ [Actinomycetota bacterium]|nr:hypothetical protein [Actinomycetota bacterium]
MAIVYDLGERVVLRLRGPATMKFLHDVSTQDLAELRSGFAATTAFLTEKGRILAIADVLVGDDGAYLIAEPAARPGLERAVTRIAPLAGVEIDEERRYAVHVDDGQTLLGKRFALPAGEAVWTETGEAFLVRDDTGTTLFTALPTEVIGSLISDGATAGDASAIESRRIAAARPRYGIDVTEDTHINETPLIEQSVSFTKGCYPGQESVARIRNLGKVHRMLRVLEVTSEVAAGDEVTLDRTVIGNVTSAAPAYAFAMVQSLVPPGTRVSIGRFEASVTDTGWTQ